MSSSFSSLCCRCRCVSVGSLTSLTSFTSSSVPSPFASAPVRSFSKAMGTFGFDGSGAARRGGGKKKAPGGTAGSGDGTAAAGGGAGDAAAAGGSAGQRGGGGGGGGGGDSVAALEAENEERLAPFMLPIITARPPPDTRSPEQQVADWQYEKEMRRRLEKRFIRQNTALSGKLRRRWEALNGLTPQLRAVCLVEDRRTLPSSLRKPLQANGQPLFPTTPGLAGAEPWTDKEIRNHLQWEQKQKERGLDY